MAVTKVVMPKLSEAMESGKIIKWLKKEGDRIAAGDILAEVETDKADVEMEAFGAGVLRKILAQAGSTAPVGSLIGVIAEPDDDIAAVAASAPAAEKPAAAPAAPAGAKAAAGAAGMASRPAEVPPTPKGEDHAERVRPAPVTASSSTARAAASSTATESAGGGAPPPAEASGRVKASPLARKIAAQSGVDLKVVQGSGPGGRIIRRDVEAASAAPAARPGAVAAPGVEFEDHPLSQMRATIARRMPQSKGPVPHFYVTSEVAMDRAWALREELNGLDGQPKISLNDLVVRACALALLEHPGVNASFQGDSIRVYHHAHIGIAVALEEGLITPVLRDCHAKSLGQIAVESRDLAERARNRKLRAQEMSGATFSISNLGMFDVAEFSAIINPPEGAILAVGSVRRVPVVEESGVGVGRRMNMTISCDHRVMDGAMGAKFLQDVKRLLEEPLRLLL
ncbi:MAG TPA: dihydrolipoamide acetyltransferase family protein [Candidatus Limnocylindria bacterium]|nr:dihydrolipoamide acetyltransferase family protein [Candidatus Limnocylindria bacterium]